MDKNAIKKYAIWARRELLEKISQKAMQYEIEDGKELNVNTVSVNGKLLSETEIKQRTALVKKIQENGYNQVMEEVAYTWFNRFVAIRFMEVNGYLPSHIRVFSDESGKYNPQIISEALHLEMEGLDKNLVIELKTNSQDEELFKYLLRVQCNDLNRVLPGLFQKLEDYTELLLPDYLLREGSVIEKLVNEIPEDDFNLEKGSGQVEIIGWLYQFYNDEKKDQVINIYKGAVKKEDIPAATQLFTTDWVVKYIVDNSLGRYWIEHRKNSELQKKLKYYVPYEKTVCKEEVDPATVTFLDPSMGSGHFLIYAFDVFMEMYMECGYSERDAANSIVKNNLYGLDIDERAAQLSYFSVMMKARQYDRRFFSRNVVPNVKSICESNTISRTEIDSFAGQSSEVGENLDLLIEQMKDAKVYGSIIEFQNINIKCLEERIEELKTDSSLITAIALMDIEPLVSVAKILSKKYTIVATNPPYLNSLQIKSQG